MVKDKKTQQINRDSFGAEEIAEEQLTSQAPPPPDDKQAAKNEKKRSKKGEGTSQALSSTQQQQQDSDSTRLAKNLALAPPSGHYTAGSEEEECKTSITSNMMSTTSGTTQQSSESRPGAERVMGPFPTSGRSLGTVIVGGAEGDDPTALTNDSTTVTAGTIVEAELVRDKTVDAVPLSEDVEQGYQELQKDYKVLRKRVLIGVMIFVIGGIVAGIVVGTRGSNSNSNSAGVGGSSTPTSPACRVDLDVKCAVDGLASCNDIPTSCTSPPVTLVFTYNGRKCSDSLHNQRSSSFTCIDVGNDSLEALTSQAYIVATDVATGQIYRQGPIALNDIFWASNFQSQLGEAMNITVYATRDQDTILQTLVYRSDCSQDLSLSNRFGALTLTRLITEEQGIVESDNGMVNVTYTYTVTNAGSENVTIDSLTPTLGDFVLLPNEMRVLTPGNTREFQQTLPIDVTTRQLYTLNATLMAAQGNDEASCSSFDVYEFEAGLLPPSESPTAMPVPPSPQPTPPPTVAPTPQPTLSPIVPQTAFPTGAPSQGVFQPQPPRPTAPIVPPTGELVVPTSQIPFPPTISPSQGGVQPQPSRPMVPAPTPFVAAPTNPPNQLQPSPVVDVGAPSTAAPNEPTPQLPQPTLPPARPSGINGEPTPGLLTLPPVGPSVGEGCMVDINVDCTIGGTDCNSLAPLVQTQCEERPIAMGFRYLGGDCALSSSDQLFDCVDASRDGPDVYLVAFDVASGTVYESRMIAFGDEFSVQDFGNNEGNILNITTYTSSDRENMIQTVQFDRSCSNVPLSLGDRFGASQLTVYVNNQQGVVTSVVEATLAISISSVSPVTIDSLTSSLPVSTPVDLVLNTASIGPGETAQVELTARVDLSFEGFIYSNFFQVFVQKEKDGSFCSSSETFDFEVPGVAP